MYQHHGQGTGRAGEISAPWTAGLVLDPPPRASSLLSPGTPHPSPPTSPGVWQEREWGCSRCSTSLYKGLDTGVAPASDLDNPILGLCNPAIRQEKTPCKGPAASWILVIRCAVMWWV